MSTPAAGAPLAVTDKVPPPCWRKVEPPTLATPSAMTEAANARNQLFISASLDSISISERFPTPSSGERYPEVSLCENETT
jgi:hypothetical protein